MFFVISFLLIIYPVTDGNAFEIVLPNHCEQKETILANLDLAKESICKAKIINAQNFTNETRSTCYSEKYAGFLNVAVKLITDAKNILETKLKPFAAMGRPIDCGDVMSDGMKSNGEYTIWPRSRVLNESSIRVYCDMKTDQGGWTVIQRRGNFSKQEDFYVSWQKYKSGFGNISRDFWIGNDNIFALSNQGVYQIRFDLQDYGKNRAYAVYDTFWIDGEGANYKLHIKNYSGNAGDSMAEHNGQPFSTKDRRNDVAPGEPCSATRHSAWWYLNCAKANLNGLYQPGKEGDYKSMYWYQWKKLDGLLASEIKIRRRSSLDLLNTTPL